MAGCDASAYVNGVDVAPLVEAELNGRFPGRAHRRAQNSDGLRAAWSELERTWTATLERVPAMPAGTVDTSVGGEWSFAQTLRHLVMATDTWLGRAALGLEEPYHPLGQPNAEYATGGYDMSVFTSRVPSYAEVLEVRGGRVSMVRDFLATVTADEGAPPLRRTRPRRDRGEVGGLNKTSGSNVARDQPSGDCLGWKREPLRRRARLLGRAGDARPGDDEPELA